MLHLRGTIRRSTAGVRTHRQAGICERAYIHMHPCDQMRTPAELFLVLVEEHDGDWWIAVLVRARQAFGAWTRVVVECGVG